MDNEAQLVIGPMFSGKTDEVLRRVRRYRHIRNADVLLFKYVGDTRDGITRIMSRGGATEEATALVSSGEEIKAVVQGFIPEDSSRDVILAIAIDEGQFIRNLRHFVSWALLQQAVCIKLFISALDSKYTGDMWEEVVSIIPLCLEVNKLSAICKVCQCREAQLTKRIVDSTELELIGSKEYVAACYPCHY
jgi:thymidine kinase